MTAEATDVNKTSNNRAFQLRVVDWMMETFSMEVCRDTTERNHRYLEESLELVQAMGCTQAEAHMLVDYVFGRPAGEPEQEVGGAMVTLAALCAAADFSMRECGERELSRCWQNIERIRAKQAGKPRHSPLPGPTPVATPQPASKDRAPTYRQDLIRRLWGLQCDDLPADAKRAMAEAATELEQVQPPETPAPTRLQRIETAARSLVDVLPKLCDVYQEELADLISALDDGSDLKAKPSTENPYDLSVGRKGFKVGEPR